MNSDSNTQKYILKPALCLDFDGTIRHSTHKSNFINKAEEIMLFPDVEDTLWKYHNEGYLICGITNQGGVAYGFHKPEEIESYIQVTLDLFKKNPFDMVQTSLNHEKGKVEPYKHRSLLRKPDIGMLVLCEVEALKKGIIIDWTNSIFVGDRPEDKECAQRADIQFIHADVFFGRQTNPENKP